MVCEDKPAGLRASLAFHHMLSRLEMLDCCEMTLWRLDLLEHSWACEEAAKAAASADVVLISMSGDQELSAATGPWLSLWSELRGNSAQALGLLFDSERLRAPEAVETALYFYRFALDCGSDSFLGWSDTTRAERWSKRCDRRADKRVGRELESTRNFEMQTNPHGL
jgi:hypothetical protein